jgi:hypothetical protein
MEQWIVICIFLSIILMPLSLYATEDNGIVWVNLGVDFYSRIDDAGDSLAQGIITRRVGEMWTYQKFGCGAPAWLSSIRVMQSDLDKLSAGYTDLLVKFAGNKWITISTNDELKLRTCIVDKYNTIKQGAYSDQNTLEVVWNIWLYTDGDTANSDYDILSDISRINTIIFKEKYDYNGSKNGAAKAIASMLSGKPIAPLFVESTTGFSGSTSSWGTTGGSSSWSVSSTSSAPWANICTDSVAKNPDNLFWDGFVDDINSSLSWRDGWDGVSYDIPKSTGIDPTQASVTQNFWWSEKSDFFHSLPCDGIFCITLNTQGGSQNLLGWYANVSIESLLEKHIKMMDPISWSDLASQKMTNNSYQLPFLNIKFKNKIGWWGVFISESIQPKRNLEREATEEIKNAKFDADFKCAMHEAWLPGDPKSVNGFIGGGYMPGWKNTDTINNKNTPLGGVGMENLAGCYQIRLTESTNAGFDSLSTDLNEIQGFTYGMIKMIWEILETDKKLDTLPTK